MNDLDLLFLMFILSLGSILVGIIIGFPMGERHVLKQLGREYAESREDVKTRAFARLEKAEAAASVVTIVDDSARCSVKIGPNILDAEVIE